MEQLIVIKYSKDLPELERAIDEAEFISYDTETTGTDKDAEIIGFSISTSVDTGYYVSLAYWDVISQKLVYRETKDQASRILSKLLFKQLIMHNAVFDCEKTYANFRVDLMPHVHTDTMILAHLLDENRSAGLKELAVSIFGESSKQEQLEMKESVLKNGGVLTKAKYELYKGDEDLIAKYGAKDTILTLKLFYHLVPQLYDQGLDTFFYDDESMPLLRGPTYDLNTTGLKVDTEALSRLKGELEVEVMKLKAFIYKEIETHISAKYPGTNKKNTFNIESSQQRSWLLFHVLGKNFNLLTKEGKNVCKFLGLPIPYTFKAKRDFIAKCTQMVGHTYKLPYTNDKGKQTSSRKITDWWKYTMCDKGTMGAYATSLNWVKAYLEYAKAMKLLSTYVIGIQSRLRYGVINPSFLQIGTTSGRYSSRNPNFQNLPRNDKRVKGCIVARDGNVFVGADYSQLEPRVFASFSGDKRLLDCFAHGDDFYSVIGVEIFDKQECSLKKDDHNSFASKYPKLRQIAKEVALATTYGATANRLAPIIGKSTDDTQKIIDSYFEKFPSVFKLMTDSHEIVKNEFQVLNLFGRPRRLPDAKVINELYSGKKHTELSYDLRTILNLAINHRIQGSASSIMNRASILVYEIIIEFAKENKNWNNVKIVLQVHDELIIEGPEYLQDQMAEVLKGAMENAVILPGVKLIAEPKIGKNLAQLK